MKSNKIVSQNEWIKARKELLVKEKEFTKLRDQLNSDRRSLPWVKVEKDYFFEGNSGKQNLADLFNGKSQLLIYHFMFGPDWEQGCKSCSFWADNFNGIDIHLAHRDISFLAVSRNNLKELEEYKKRMGWSFNWVSSVDSDFNYDFNVSFSEEQRESNQTIYNYREQPYFIDELAGVSVFLKDDLGEIYHTYSAYSRGIDILNGAYNYIDLTPKGRDEGEGVMKWLRHHDKY